MVHRLTELALKLKKRKKDTLKLNFKIKWIISQNRIKINFRILNHLSISMVFFKTIIDLFFNFFYSTLFVNIIKV